MRRILKERVSILLVVLIGLVVYFGVTAFHGGHHASSCPTAEDPWGAYCGASDDPWGLNSSNR